MDTFVIWFLKEIEDTKSFFNNIPASLNQFLIAVFITASASLIVGNTLLEISQLSKIQEIYLEMQKRNEYINLYLTDINNSLSATKQADINYSASIVDKKLSLSIKSELIEMSNLVKQYSFLVEKTDFDDIIKKNLKLYSEFNNPANAGIVSILNYIDNNRSIKRDH